MAVSGKIMFLFLWGTGQVTFIHCQRYRMCVTSKVERSYSNLNQYAIRLLAFAYFSELQVIW